MAQKPAGAAGPKGPRFKKQQEEMTLAEWIIAKRNGYTGPKPGTTNKKAKKVVESDSEDDGPPPPPRRKPPPKKPPPRLPPKSESEDTESESEEEKENTMEKPTKDLSDIQREFDQLDPATKARAKEEADTLLKWATNGRKDDMEKVRRILKL